MTRRIEQATMDYWDVGHALRHPGAPPITTEKALKKLNSSDRLLPIAEENKLSSLMHTIRYDIIEGNSSWREQARVVNSKLIPLIRD